MVICENSKTQRNDAINFIRRKFASLLLIWLGFSADNLGALRLYPNLGMQYGSPIRLSGEVGGFMPLPLNKEMSINDYGLRVAGEIGVSGSKAIIGYGLNWRPETFSGHVIPHHFSLNFFLLRTYGDPISLAQSKTFFGIELRLSFIAGLKIGFVFGDSPVMTYGVGLMI